jgi:cell division protein FtsW
MKAGSSPHRPSRKNRKRSAWAPGLRAFAARLGATAAAPAHGIVAGLRRLRAAWRKKREPAEKPGATAELGLDLPMLLAVLSLLGLGLVVVYSSSAVHMSEKYGSGFYYLKRDLAYMLVGLVALLVGMRIDYGRYRPLVYPLLLGCLVLLAAVLVPSLGTRVDGASRWLRLGGLSIQPSEPTKFALVLYLAHSLAKKKEEVKTFTIGFLPHLCVAGFLSALVLKQPDLGTTAVLLTVTLMMLFVAGTKLSYILLSVLAAAPIAWKLIVGTPWRMRRLLAFLDPWAHRQDAGYQISESLISIGSGGLHGLGLGDGKQKLFFLPAAHTDFIFAAIGEELGLIGLLAVVVLFLLLLARGLRASLVARDLFGSYLAFGLTATFGLQALLHTSVVLGLVPTKGITLPFVSYGGSSLATSLFCLGVLMNIASRAPASASVRAEGARRAAAAGNRKRPSRVMPLEDAGVEVGR